MSEYYTGNHYKSANGYSGVVRRSMDEHYTEHIELVIYNPNNQCKALFVLDETPSKSELQQLIDDFPKYIGMLKGR